MLVLNRKIGEQIVVPHCGLVFTILEVQGDKVSVGITAPLDVKVHRREVWERIQKNSAREEAEIHVNGHGNGHGAELVGNGVHVHG